MRVGAVVLHYRRWPEVRECLDALLAQEPPPVEVVVVDNASRDGSVDELRSAFGELRVVEAPDNRGYGAGMNLGIATLEHDVDAVLLLTHEAVLAPGALAALAGRLADEPRLGAVGPLVAFRSEPDRVYSAGGFIDRSVWRPRHVQRPREVSAWLGGPPREAEWLDGSVLLLRRLAHAEAGPIDEGYFMYFEETDHLLRLGELGWGVECVPTALAWQEPGSKPTRLHTRNRLRFVARRAPRRFLVRELLKVGRSMLRTDAGEPGRRRAELQGTWDFLRGRTGPPPVGHRPTGSAPST